MGKIGGIAVATITPFREDGGIDYSFIEQHMEMLEREGAHGVVPVGTNGEFPSLTVGEKKRVLEVAAAARGKMFLIAGCGSCSLPETIELIELSRDSGADAALVVPPFYFRDAEPRGIVDFYRQVLKSTHLPVFLYNIPAYTGIAITDEMLEPLLEHSNLAGVKDTGGDPARTAELISRYPGLRIFGGSDSLVGDAVGAGAAGVISGAANIFPGLVREVWDARERGEEIAAAGARVREIRLLLERFPWIAATKHCLALRGLPDSRVRPPQVELTAKEKNELANRLKEMGLL